MGRRRDESWWKSNMGRRRHERWWKRPRRRRESITASLHGMIVICAILHTDWFINSENLAHFSLHRARHGWSVVLTSYTVDCGHLEFRNACIFVILPLTMLMTFSPQSNHTRGSILFYCTVREHISQTVHVHYFTARPRSLDNICNPVCIKTVI